MFSDSFKINSRPVCSNLKKKKKEIKLKLQFPEVSSVVQICPVDSLVEADRY